MTVKELLAKQKYYSPIKLLWTGSDGKFQSKYFTERDRYLVVNQFGNYEIDYFNFETDYEQFRVGVYPFWLRRICTKVFYKINPQVLRIELK